MDKRLLLIDTSIWILSLRADGLKKAVERTKKSLEEDTAATTEIIILELLGGEKREQEYRELLEDLQALPLLSITEKVWSSAFRLSFELRKKGIVVPSTDILIAAVAIDYNCILLHFDAHFDLIAKHTPLKVESLVKV